MNVSWNAFFIFTALGLVVYYAIVIFVFYKKKPALAGSGSNRQAAPAVKKNTTSASNVKDTPLSMVPVAATSFIDTKVIHEEDFITQEIIVENDFPEYDPSFNTADTIDETLNTAEPVAEQTTQQPVAVNEPLQNPNQLVAATMPVQKEAAALPAEPDQYIAEVPWETLAASANKQAANNQDANSNGLQEHTDIAAETWYTTNGDNNYSVRQPAAAMADITLAEPEREPQQMNSLMHLVSSKKAFH